MSNPQLVDPNAVQKVTVAEKQTTAGALKEAATLLKEEKDTGDEKVATELRKSRFYEKVVMPLAVAFLGTMQVISIAYIGLLDRRGSRMEQTVTATHELVNSGSLVNLRLTQELSHWKADQTKLPSDIRAAEAADNLVSEHIEKQKRSDAMKGK